MIRNRVKKFKNFLAVIMVPVCLMLSKWFMYHASAQSNYQKCINRRVASASGYRVLFL